MEHIRVLHSIGLCLVFLLLNIPSLVFANEVSINNFKKCRAKNTNFILFEKKSEGVRKGNSIEEYKLSKNSAFYISEFELESIPFKPRSIPMIPDRYDITPVFYIPEEGSYWMRLFVASADVSDDVIGYKIKGRKLEAESMDIYFAKLEDLGRCDKLEIGFRVTSVIK
ncbi:MAG: hypothetical protein ACN6O1_13335 [Comamonas sp.]|uniref:hypothetical protein n=1 Tax=Comamonas sp. TaxID=34028 RepID=UPI003D0EC8D3